MSDAIDEQQSQIDKRQSWRTMSNAIDKKSDTERERKTE